MTRDELREKANDLPAAPGVYLMMDKSGRVIYVGKAKKLKNRVSQYFQDSAGHSVKTRAMVAQVDHFDTIFVSSEFEALVLENSLIKQHQPRYNILLKDDKGYPFVRLSNEEYPRFSLASRIADDGARYFGPFGARSETRAAVDAVCAALRLPTCSHRFPRDIGKSRPCLNHHMGRCDAFCRGTPDRAEYLARIEQAVLILEGRYKQLARSLREEMERAAEGLQFERAAALRDSVRAVETLGKRQKVIAGICADTDVWGICRGAARCAYAVLHVEDGQLTYREAEIFDAPIDESEEQMLSALLARYYFDRAVVPREILLPCAVEDAQELAQSFSEKSGRRVQIRVPSRGERAGLCEMAQRNAREEVERVTTQSERTDRTLRRLGEMLALPDTPRRMEAYDISNTGASDIVASMTVFCDAKPLKRDYRRFRIKSLDGHADDYASMREVITRRVQRYLDGDEKFSTLPDIFLIDGGAVHARTAHDAALALGVDAPFFGMVKDDRHRTRALVTPDGEEISIAAETSVFALIGRVQEETHRFAVAYHHELHGKNATRSQLDAIEGVGEARRKKLMAHFKTVRAIREASEEQLCAVVPKNVARAVYAHFHGETTS